MAKEQKGKENQKEEIELIILELIPPTGVYLLTTPHWKRGVETFIEKIKSFFS